MDDEKLLQIADDQLNFLDRMSALHRQRMLDSIQALERRIVDRASALKTSDSGNLLGAKTNLAQAQKVHSDMTALFDEEYGAASRETVKEYSESLPVIQQQYEEMGEAVKYTGVDRDMVKGLKSMDLAAYTSYGLAAQDKIAKAVYNHVIAQAPFSALVSEIAAALTGQKDKRGRPLANYAKQMANDGIMNFHNTVNLKKAEDAKFEHYLYVGNIIADSRPFCIARAGNVYTREQIDSWTGPWQGKSGPAFTHRGGYNCRHHWQPVRKEWIPEGGIEVQSWFDRAGVMPVSKLPKSVTGAPKFKAWQAWQQSVLIGKKPLDAAAVAKAAGVPKSAASGWLSQWQRGYNLPQGWQSAVRDLEAKAGGFELAGVEALEAIPGGKKSISALNKLTTGEQLKPTLYRGHGTTDHRTPSQFAEGTYWSPHKEVSQTYGPELITKELELRNPYAWDLPGKKPYFIELEEHFGTKNPKKITQMLQEKGYDYLVVRNVPVMRGEVVLRDSIEVIALDKPLAKAASQVDLPSFEKSMALKNLKEKPRLSFSGKPSQNGRYVKSELISSDVGESLEGQITIESKKIKDATGTNFLPELETKGFVSDAMMNVGDLVGWQPVVEVKKVEGIINSSMSIYEPVTVIKYQGNLVLWDGYHRVAANKLGGSWIVRAKIFDLDSYLTSK